MSTKPSMCLDVLIADMRRLWRAWTAHLDLCADCYRADFVAGLTTPSCPEGDRLYKAVCAKLGEIMRHKEETGDV